MFNEYMTAMQNLNGYVSNFTLAALESSGWYSSVDYSWSEPSTYGRGKGCEFMRIDNCDFEEYCQDANSYGCVWAGTGEGQCLLDDFTDNCQIYVYFTNTVCISENFLSTNLNINANALEVGGYNSRCFLSDFHVPDITPTNLKSRCYVTRCALNSKYIYIVLTKKTVLVCTQPGMVINAPKSLGLTGQLTCPTNFSNYC